MVKTKNKNTSKTNEQVVAETILQTSTTGSTISIDGQEYTITDPTPATLMMVSSEVSKLPKVDMGSENILFEVLRTAKDMQSIGRIAAILILGAKRIREGSEQGEDKGDSTPTTRRNGWLAFLTKNNKKEAVRKRSELDTLAQKCLETVTIRTLSAFIGKRLSEMQVGDFFGLTTSLSAVNLLKATKEVETVHGE